MELMEKTVESQVLFSGKIITVRLDRAQLPNGRIASREVVEHPGGVAILPLFDDGTVPLVRQFRYPFGAVVEELPAGKLEKGEDHRLAALRELEEEVGARCGKLTYLGCLYASPGFSSEVLHMDRHSGWTLGENNHGEEKVTRFYKEYPNVEIAEFYSDSLSDTPLARLAERVMAGEITDAKTVALVLKAKLLLGL